MVKPVKTSENVAYYHNIKYSSIQQLNKNRKMHGVKRVVAFCIFIVILPATLIIIPLYLRHSVFADVIYPVAESDIIEIRDGISSIFCEKHSLHMNTTFNAFQLQSKPEISRNRKHIRLKKSMTLPDDTLEYWGFYLLKGAIVELKVCSRYEGSRILLVKGDRNLNTCGLLEHNKNKVGTHFAHGYDKVQVTLETVAEVVVSEEEKSSMNYNITHLNERGRESKNFEGEHNYNNFQHNHHHNKISTEEIKSVGGDYQSDTNYYYDDDDGDNNENHGGEDLHEDNNHKLSLKYGNKVLNSLKRKSDQNKKQRKFDDKRKIIHNNYDGSGGGNVADGLLSNSNKTENVTKNIKIAEEFTQINDSNKNSRQNLINSQKIRHRRHHNKRQQQQQQEEFKKSENVENEKLTEIEKEHLKFIKNEHERKKKEIMKQLYDKIEKNKNLQHNNNNNNNGKNEKFLLDRKKRDTVYDAKIAHGGNALNFTENESNSVSSFENGLLTCYDGQILLAQSFNPSSLCTSIRYLENGTHMIAKHEVEEDGYYYYIFYSDNDLVANDIHAVFDIYKPTYQYTNITDSKGCVNNTNCTFPINFLSDEIVVVEVPTRDGIEHEDDDITFLISTCHPRMSVYIIFPILVLVLILSCSFL